MKHTPIIFAFLLLALASSAQLNNGSWVTGGSLKFEATSSDANSQHTTDFRLSPQTFYTLSDHWGIGGGLNFEMSSTKYDNSGAETKTTTTRYGIAPGLRYYGSIAKTVSCYMQANACFNMGTIKSSYTYAGNTDEVTAKISDFGARFIPGIMWSPKPNILLDFNYGSLMYDHATTKLEDGDEKFSDSDFKLSLNPLCICVGLYYAFGNGGGMIE
jgi:hypothetical protein